MENREVWSVIKIVLWRILLVFSVLFVAGIIMDVIYWLGYSNVPVSLLF